MENREGEAFQERLEALEEALKLDARLQVVESTIEEKTGRLRRPWWKNGTTVTLLASLVTAIVFPLVNLINNYFISSRESRRLLLEQQEKYVRPTLTEY
jgi:hypothetical protein